LQLFSILFVKNYSLAHTIKVIETIEALLRKERLPIPF